ncbi:Alpha-tocopherol transfer protein-like [Frankliniella fusca]|uniref:Alpha-tocopherol transfer protein-like n=1 Tax=Frankliniella fusca TaxID=407009 RepID=A0AAE1GXK0_9NEOP|nr:Alpha-tocopherol transfer protein-like [Frankliniella fusca]
MDYFSSTLKEQTRPLLHSPSAEEARQVRKEINNTYPDKQRDCVRQLKDWMQTQPHLPRNYDERILPRFLNGTKYDVHRAKRKIDAYFTARAKMPEFFAQRDPSSKETQQAWRALSVLPLARTRRDGARVTLHILNDVDATEHVASSIYKMIFMISDIRLVEEAEISGDVFVFDLANVSLTIMLKHAGSMLKKVLSLAQGAYPQRLKEIHIINAHPFVNKGINLFRSFMKEKMRNRFVVHSSLESLHKYVPADLLPAEYGGGPRTVENLCDQWNKALESYTLYFQQQEGVKATLGKASHKSAPAPAVQPVQGSFRNLGLD